MLGLDIQHLDCNVTLPEYFAIGAVKVFHFFIFILLFPSMHYALPSIVVYTM